MMELGEFSTRINLLIEKMGQSRKTFAESMGVSHPLIIHLCNGRNNPSLEILQKIIVKHPDVSPEWLITGNGNMMKAVENTEVFKKNQVKLNEIDKLIIQSNQSLHQAVKIIRELKQVSKPV